MLNNDVILHQANNFALFWLTLFCPEKAFSGTQTIKAKYDWAAFLSWMNSIENLNIIKDCLQFHSLQRYVCSLTSTSLHHDITNAHRRQFSDTLGKHY